MTQRDRSADDGLTPRQVTVWVDASRGDFYDPSGGAGDLAVVYTDEHEADVDHPFPEERAAGIFDPRCLRYHDLQRDVPGGGFPDRRLSIQIVNDYEGPYESARPGDAPFGQPEEFTSLNRSTREADLFGRVALPQSQRRIVDSEDGRFALALVTGAGPPLGGSSSAGQIADGTVERSDLDGVAFAGAGARSTAGGLGALQASQPSVSIDGLTVFGQAAVDAARAAIEAGGTKADVARWAVAASQGKELPPLERDSTTRTRGGSDGAGTPTDATRARPVRSPADQPGGYVIDEHGKVGLLSTLVTPSGQPQHWFTGREGTRIGILPWRHDAQIAMAPDKVGRIAFVGADAKDVPKGRGKLVKGEMWFDSSRANVDSELGDETGQWVPVVALDPNEITFPPRTWIQPPPRNPPPFPPPPRNPPPPPIPFVGGPTNIGKPGFIQVPNPFDPSGPWGSGLLPFPPEPSVDNALGGAGAPVVTTDPGPPGGEDGPTGRVDPGGETVDQGQGDGVQTRDLEGPGVPCPNLTAGLYFSVHPLLGGGGLQIPVNMVQDPSSGQVVTPGHPAVESSGDALYLGGSGEPGSQVGVAAGGPPRFAIPLEPGGPEIAFGGMNVANMSLPYLGTPGAPSTLQGAFDLMTAKVNALTAIQQAAFGGPSYLASNIAVQHRNSPGNPPTSSVVGSRWAATPGQELLVDQAVVEHVSVLVAPEGSTIRATGPGVQRIARELRGPGQIRDERPLVQLSNGGALGPLVASSEGFGVSRQGQVESRGVRVQDPPADEPPIAVYHGDRPTWAVQPDGVQRHQQVATHPTRPVDPSEARTYVKDGSLYVQTSTGETQLGAGGGGGGDVDEIVVASPLTGGGTGTVNIGLGTVPVSKGGTGAVNASGARENLGIEIGVDVQEHSAVLDALVSAAAGASDGYVLTSDGEGGVAFEEAPGGGGGLVVSDGTVDDTFTELVLPAGTLTDNEDGSVTADLQPHHANLDELAGLTLATNNMLGINSSGDLAQFAAGTRQHLARLTGGALGFTGILDLTQPNALGFAELESTGNANSGSYQLNIDMTTTSGSLNAGAESAIDLKMNGATLNKFKVRADGVGGADLYLRNISGTTSSLWVDDSSEQFVVGIPIQMPTQAAPSTPATGTVVLYADSTTGTFTGKKSTGVIFASPTPQTAPSEPAPSTASATNGSGWTDSTAQTQFNLFVAAFNDFVNNDYNGVSIGSLTDQRSANLAAGLYV